MYKREDHYGVPNRAHTGYAPTHLHYPDGRNDVIELHKKTSVKKTGSKNNQQYKEKDVPSRLCVLISSVTVLRGR
ncbi:hypothetical protein Tco_0094622, partial [Tanacetum coccineum]